MLTTDLAPREDPAYREITRRWLSEPAQFEDAFAGAWFKLTHRDLGPRTRYLGSMAPQEELLWQDPVPAVDHELVNEADIATLKGSILASGLSVSQLVKTAWAAASSFRATDMCGGANGARLRLAPQDVWAVNDPTELGSVIEVLEGIQQDFNAGNSPRKVSLADLIVLGGVAAIEKAAADAGHDVSVPFTPGRTDATQETTDVESFAYLEPTADGFHNYVAPGSAVSPAVALVDKADTLKLTVPEMMVLVAGLRVMRMQKVWSMACSLRGRGP